MDYEKAYKEALERAKTIHNEHRAQCADIMTKVFPELCVESEDERIRKEIIDCLKYNALGFAEQTRNKWFAWLEKQGEHKSVGKIEPKFKVGDWITNGEVTFKIDKVFNTNYTDTAGAIHDIESTDANYHLWTIEDAKDGDILFIGIDASTCIFKKLEGNSLYSYIITDGTLLIGNSNYYYETSDNVYPATTEQRIELFRKMHAAGFEWNAKIKELTKKL